MGLPVLLHLLAGAYGGTVVHSGEHQPIVDGIDEIEQADGHEEHHSQKVGNDFLVVHISKE